MELSDLFVSYKQINAPKYIPTEFVSSYNNFQIDPEISQQPSEQPVEQPVEEKPKQKEPVNQPKKQNQERKMFPKIRGSVEFEQAYDEVERINPEAKRYRAFLTKIAKEESGFNKSIQNRAGAPAYGYFQFMQDGVKYNNISKYAKTDIETFRNDPKIQIQAAIRLAQDFERGFSKQDLDLARQKGFTTFGLLGGAWLGGVGGVRKYLQGLGNPSDKHWGKSGYGTTVGDRIKMFNFKRGGVIW